MQAGSLIPVLFSGAWAGNISGNKQKKTGPLPPARWVRVKPRPRSACGLAHLGKGDASPPIASPRAGASLHAPHQTRFAFWTSDRSDFISPWTLDQRETSLSLWAAIDQAYAAMDPQQGFRAPAPRTGRRAAPVPLPNPGRIGCAPDAPRRAL